MYHPTSRVLTVLELLQSRPSITGPELAERLEMDIRTVRRYITILQDVGIPVEGTIGRHGGYRLRPGFKLPPLMFTEEEASAIVLGLLGSAWLEVDLSSFAVEGALAKVSRVLPFRARDRLNALAKHLVLSPQGQANRPDATLLIDLTQAIQEHRRIEISYRSLHNAQTRRKVEPYGINGWDGHWYLVGYCCMRQEVRTFRLDRVQEQVLLTETFERDASFDFQAYITEKYRLDQQSARWQISVEFQAELEYVQQRIPAAYGTFTTTETGTLFTSSTNNLESQARYLLYLNIPFTIVSPPEFSDALLKIAGQITEIARTGKKTSTKRKAASTKSTTEMSEATVVAPTRETVSS